MEKTKRSYNLGYLGLYGKQKTDCRLKNLRKMIVREVGEGPVLDLGCGLGHLTEGLAVRGFEVVGVDKDETMVKLAKKFLDEELPLQLRDKAEIRKGDENSLEKDHYGTIICSEILEHIEDDNQFLHRLRLSLKNSGKVVIVVPAYQSLFDEHDKQSGHFRRYSRKELVGKVELAGFRVSSVRSWNVLGLFAKVVLSRIMGKEKWSDLYHYKGGFLNRVLDLWFSLVENSVRLPFGLNLLVVGEKK